MPILKADADDVWCAVAVRVVRTAAVDDPNVATLFKPITPSLTGLIFSESGSMNFDAFRKAFPAFNEQALARYLAPLVKNIVEGRTADSNRGRQAVKEHVRVHAEGGGLSLPLGGGSVSDEERDRRLATLNESSGVQLRYDASTQSYLPVSVRVWKLAKGWETKEVGEVERVYVGTRQLQNVLVSESPNQQTFTSELVDASLGRIIACRRQADGREAEARGKLETVRTKLLAKIEQEQRALDDEEAQRASSAASVLRHVKGVEDVRKATTGLTPALAAVDGKLADATTRQQNAINDVERKAQSSTFGGALRPAMIAKVQRDFAPDFARYEAEKKTLVERRDRLQQELKTNIQAAEKGRAAVESHEQAKKKHAAKITRLTADLEKLDEKRQEARPLTQTDNKQEDDS